MAGVARSASPFFYDVAARTAKGAALGFGVSFFFFSSWRTRRLATFYGAGFGLGMSSSEVKALWRGLIKDDQETSDRKFYADVNSLQREIELRNKIK